MKYYDLIAARLREYMIRENISTSKMAGQVEEQYNTVQGILNGNRFMAHHTLWLSKYIDITSDKGDSGDNQQQKNEGLETFI